MNQENQIDYAATLEADIVRAKNRTVIYECFRDALTAHKGKPIGKRLCKALEDRLNNHGIKFQSVYIGGTKESKEIVIYFGGVERESIGFGWKAKEVSEQTITSAENLYNSIYNHFKELETKREGLDERAQALEAICKSIAEATAGLRAACDGLPWGVVSKIKQKYSIR